MNPRLVDFEKRISGASYQEIAQAGEDIRSSIEAVRKASRGALAEKILAALHEMTEYGTTTVEAKSGYGLSVDSELKSLEAIRDAASRWPGTVVKPCSARMSFQKSFKITEISTSMRFAKR